MGRKPQLDQVDMILVQQIREAARQAIAERKARIARLAVEIQDIRRMTAIQHLAEGYGVSHMTLRRVLGSE